MNGRAYKFLSLLLYLVGSLNFASAKGNPSLEKLQEELKELRKKVDAHEKRLFADRDISHFRLPSKAKLCGKAVPLSDGEVSRRIEFEILLMMQDRGQVTLWLRRAKEIFPRIEAVLAQSNGCDDLKYLALIESGLRPTALSHASAKGYWQFIPSTGKHFGLSQHSNWDDRSDFLKSTKAAHRYLTELHAKFGSWPLAMAAYNTGPSRLASEIEAQGVSSYWRLRLFREAERYVPRVIAAKIILERLADFGMSEQLTPGWGKPRTTVVPLKLDYRQTVNLKSVARGGGLDYRKLTALNPELTDAVLKGPISVDFEVPVSARSPFRSWLRKNVKTGRESRRPNAKSGNVRRRNVESLKGNGLVKGFTLSRRVNPSGASLADLICPSQN